MEVPSSSFTLFSNLPTELRHKIWHFSHPQSRLITGWESSTSLIYPFLLCCHESFLVLTTSATFTRFLHSPTWPLVHGRQERPQNWPFYASLHTDIFHFSLIAFPAFEGVKKIFISCDATVIGVRRCLRYVLLRLYNDAYWVEEVSLFWVAESANSVRTRLRTEREKEEFLEKLASEARFELEENQDFIEACKRRSKGNEVEGWVWKLPKVVFDVDGLTVMEEAT